MKIIGYLVIAVGFLGGAFVAVLDKVDVQWLWFVLALAVGAAGVVLVQLSERRHSRSEERIATNLQSTSRPFLLHSLRR